MVWSFVYLALRRLGGTSRSLLPIPGRQGSRDLGAAPRARDSAPPPAETAAPGEGPGSPRRAEPDAAAGALVGLSGDTGHAAQLAPADGRPALDLSARRTGPAAPSAGGAGGDRAVGS